jgi:hypothetical protein
MRTTTDFSRIQGTSFKGHLHAHYSELVRMFGEPMNGDGYKVQAEWIVILPDEDGTEHAVTIYDWKQGMCYWGIEGEGVPVDMVKEWNVGGHTHHALWLLKDYIMKQEELEMERQWQVYGEHRMEHWDNSWLEEGL